MDLAIRGGGHSAAGFGTCGIGIGIIVDFVDRDGVRVNPVTARVRAEGIAGLTLGGGVGYLARAYGLTRDNLLSAEVVIADGTVHIARAAENEDLFWALRGGGGNFGVVTSFEHQLHPVDIVHVTVVPASRRRGDGAANALP